MGVFSLSWVFVLVAEGLFWGSVSEAETTPMCDRTALYDEHKAQLLVHATDRAQTGQLIF